MGRGTGQVNDPQNEINNNSYFTELQSRLNVITYVKKWQTASTDSVNITIKIKIVFNK